jgi:hypothetical protein
VRTERLSLRSNSDREDLARELVRAHERPVAWCLLDWASERTAALADRLVADWGPGLCYQPGAPWADPTRPAVLPSSAASRILRAARTRVWWSESDAPDKERVMESLEHGCLPLQFTQGTEGGRYGPISESLRAMLVQVDPHGSLSPLGDEELGSRLDAVSGALAAGRLEDELSRPHG